MQPIVDFFVGEERKAMVAGNGGDVGLVVVQVKAVSAFDELVHIRFPGVFELTPLTVRILVQGWLLCLRKHA